tara:strand:+ start:205 stop:339 length:135 start_codon:yes stop_codon:yes gene_type:complete
MNRLEQWYNKFKLEAQSINGGDFENWYEGLSPMRNYFYNIWINE